MRTTISKILSKPVLTVFLRYLSHHKYLYPSRIRFASFRSKSDLLTDLRAFFEFIVTGKGKDVRVDLVPSQYTLKKVPRFHYLKREKQWYVNDAPLVPFEKGAPLTCQIRRGTFVVEF